MFKEMGNVSMMVKVGIVGAGFMGSVHAEVYSQLGVEIGGVACLESDRARELTRQYGGQCYPGDLDSLLSDESVDIIDICTPTHLHRDHVLMAARSGKHILCEKPIGLTIEDARAIIRATTLAGVKFMVAHCIRFWPHYKIARDILLRGGLGRPLAATSQRVSALPNGLPSNHWELSPELSGGAVVDMGVHDWDYFTWILGRPTKVQAMRQKSPKAGGEHIFALIEHMSGSRSCIEISSGLIPPSYPFIMGFRIICEDGVLELSSGNLKLYRGNQAPEVLAVEQVDGYYREIEYFLDCVRRDKQPTVITPKDAELALQIALTVEEAANTGQIIGFPNSAGRADLNPAQGGW
jgi:predicted dehydrogenase